MDQLFLDEGTKSPELGPHYFSARKTAEDFMAAFRSEQFAPMAKKFADDLYDSVREKFEDYLLADTESNLHSHMWHQIDESVKALLSGEEWAIRRYLLTDRYDGLKIRRAVAALVPVELQNKRMIELEVELSEVKVENARLRHAR